MAKLRPLVNYIFRVANVPTSVAESGLDTDEGDITDLAMKTKEYTYLLCADWEFFGPKW